MLRFQCGLAACAGLLTLLMTNQLAAQGDGVANTNDLGIAVGEKAPEFTLKNQRGEEVELADLLKEHNVALVFYRSASW